MRLIGKGASHAWYISAVLFGIRMGMKADETIDRRGMFVLGATFLVIALVGGAIWSVLNFRRLYRDRSAA
jgi:hypothetical protein